MTNTQLPPERHFGLLFSVIFALIGVYGLFQGWSTVTLALLFGVGLLFSLTAFLMPRALRPLNRAWYHFGMLLSRVVSPIILGILFFGLVTPVALIGRLFGRDELRLRQRQRSTYWIEREPPGPLGESFHNQY